MPVGSARKSRDRQHEAANRTHDGGAAKISTITTGDVIAAVGERSPREILLDLFHMFLELPVVHVGVLPLGDKMSLQFLGELNHLNGRRTFSFFLSCSPPG